MSTYIQRKLASGTKLRIFVTGASGYIGSAFVEKATAAGHTISALSRSEASDSIITKLGATPIRGSLTTLDILTIESSKADAVVHLAWDHDFNADLSAVVDGDIAATNAIMEALSGTGRPILTASGCAGYEPSVDGSPVTEEHPRQMSIPLVAHRSRTEQNVLQRQDIHGVVIRLSPYVHGRGGKGILFLKMGQALKHRESLYIGNGDSVTSTIHVDDVAVLYLKAIIHASPSQIYHGVSSDTITARQLAEAIGEAMDVPVRSITFEEAVGLWGPLLAFFSTIQAMVSTEKSIKQLHWSPEGLPLVDDIVRGSYPAEAARMKTMEWSS